MSALRISLTIAAVLFAASHAHAEKMSIHSRFDNYDLNVNSDGSAVVDGKNVDAKTLKDILPLLTSPAGNDCPATIKGQPDASVKIGDKTRLIYLNAGQVKEGDTCLSVDGDGLQFFPVHRDFLIGPASDSIEVKSPLIVSKGDKTLLRLKKEGEEWSSEDSTYLLDWNFIESFENSLKSFRVRFRVLPAAAKGKMSLKVSSGGQVYQFYRITNQTWALLKPKGRWLEASDDWSFWFNFDDAVLADRNTAAIHTVADRAGQTLPNRLSALDKLGSTWSPNLRDLYLKIVADPEDSPEVQAVAMKRLRSKPSEATARGLAKILSKISDENQKKAATQVLKMYYPKGPLYNPNGTQSQKQQVIDFWSSRWSKKTGS